MSARTEKFPRACALMDEGLLAGRQIGAQMFVVRGGETIADEAWGEAAPGVAMKTGTRMLWMSASKPLTAVAIARLVEQSVLRWDDPVALHVPEFGVHGKEAITIRHLLSHTGGFRQADMIRQPDWEKVVTAVCAVRPEPKWMPGEKGGYHMGGSWIILGEVIRRVAGQMPDAHVRETVLLPLGMENTSLGVKVSEADFAMGRVGQVQSTEGERPRPHAIWAEPENLAAIWPGSNGIGPVRELGLFYQAMLEGGRGVLRPETVAYITSRHRTGMMDQTFKHVVDMGLGFILNSNEYGPETVPYGFGRHAGKHAFGHGGAQSSIAFADPDHQLVVAVVWNGMPGEAAHQKRAREFLTALYEDLGLV